MMVNNLKIDKRKTILSTDDILCMLSKVPGFNGTTHTYDPDTETAVFSINFHDQEPFVGWYSLYEAKERGLINNKIWETYPLEMLKAKAKQEACQKAKKMLRFLPEFSKM